MFSPSVTAMMERLPRLERERRLPVTPVQPLQPTLPQRTASKKEVPQPQPKIETPKKLTAKEKKRAEERALPESLTVLLESKPTVKDITEYLKERIAELSM